MTDLSVQTTSIADIQKRLLKTARIVWSIILLVALFFGFASFRATTGLSFSNPLVDAADSADVILLIISCVLVAMGWLLPFFLNSYWAARKGVTPQQRMVLLIIRMSFFGSVVLYGVLMATKTHDFNLALPFEILFFVNFLFIFPTRRFADFKESVLQEYSVNIKRYSAPLPLRAKIIGWTLLVLAAVDFIIKLRAASLLRVGDISDKSPQLLFGNSAFNLFILGFFILRSRQLRLVNPTLYWGVVIILSFLVALRIAALFKGLSV